MVIVGYYAHGNKHYVAFKCHRLPDVVRQSTVPTSMSGKSLIRKYTENAKNI